MELNTEHRFASLPLQAASVLGLLTKLGMRPVPVKFRALVRPDFPQLSTSLLKVDGQGAAGAARASWNISSSLSSSPVTTLSHTEQMTLLERTSPTAWPYVGEFLDHSECSLRTWKLTQQIILEMTVKSLFETIHRHLFGTCCVPGSILRAMVIAVKCTSVDSEFMALPSRLYVAEKGANKKLK